MSHTTWMLYGATGTLIAEEAIRRGHKPLLAGRSAESLASLGKRLGLPWMAVGLDEPGWLERAVSGVDAVLNAAGPFIATHPRSFRSAWQPEPITWISRAKFTPCSTSSPVTRRHERGISR
jgi:uncharacterized protein YbjT (DUF2867 family)